MPASMRSRLCCGLRFNANFRAAGDADAIAAVTIRNDRPSIFDLPLLNGPVFDLSILDVAPAIAVKHDNDDFARNDRAGGSCTFDDTATTGRAVRSAEGSHDRPFGVSVAPPACGQALRL
jgi:hypothetical protein